MIILEIFAYVVSLAVAFLFLVGFVKLFGKKPDGDEI